MFFRKAPVAVLSLAGSILLTMPALADTYMTIDSNGYLYDASGHKIKQYVMVPSGVPGAPVEMMKIGKGDKVEVYSSPQVGGVVAQPTVIMPQTVVPQTVTQPQIKKIVTTTTTQPSVAIENSAFSDVLFQVLDSRRGELER